MLNSVPSWLLEIVFYFANRSSFLGAWLERLIVNRAVSLAPRRPDPYSTVHPYISWTSLTDLSWSARHLPPGGPSDLPDAKDVIEIFRVGRSGQVACNKSTLLFPAFAQYLTDGIIRTVMPNRSQGDPPTTRRRNTSNHQFEMGALYGRTPGQTQALRLLSEEPGRRGRLKSQIIGDEEYSPFAYDDQGTIKPEFEVLDPVVSIDRATLEQRRRLFAFGGDRANVAPHVAMMNILFLREHNRLAASIEAANDEWDDERVFQTTRNSVIALFIKIGVEEYINHITPLSFRLKADPRVAWLAPWNKPNRIAIEFSLMYRWHSLIPNHVTWDLRAVPVAETLLNNQLLIEAGLARAFEQISRQPAMKLGVGNTVDALLPFELSAIEQSRICEVRSFSDYCRNTSTWAPDTFEDISSNPAVIERLRQLYRTPEHVEFYVGLFAQDTLKNSPLPDLMLKLAAMDAFSHAYTNPLLSERAFNEATFSPVGWKTLMETSTVSDVVARNTRLQRPLGYIGMTQEKWTPEYEIPVVDELKVCIELTKTSTGRIQLGGFVLATVAETAGLIGWLYLTLLGMPIYGFICLVLGELVEWSLLAIMIVTSPMSHPKRSGTVPRGLVTSGLTSLCEAFLWVGWLMAISGVGLFLATVALIAMMHVKHVAEIVIFTGRPFARHAFDGRDITATMIESVGAALAYAAAMTISPYLGGGMLLFVIGAEHLLQFRSAGFLGTR